VIEMQESGRLQDNGGTQSACRVHGAQTRDDTLCGAQVGRRLVPKLPNLPGILLALMKASSNLFLS
jgi:hypothetical protein